MLLKNITNHGIQFVLHGQTIVFGAGEIKEIENFPKGLHNSVLKEISYTKQQTEKKIEKENKEQAEKRFEDELREMKLIL